MDVITSLHIADAVDCKSLADILKGTVLSNVDMCINGYLVLLITGIVLIIICVIRAPCSDGRQYIQLLYFRLGI